MSEGIKVVSILGEDYSIKAGQQAVGQHAQAQGQLGEVVQRANARHAAQGDVFGGATDLAHLVQRKNTEKQHQRTNAREAEKRARRDIHITKRHAVVLGEARSVRL